MTEIPRNTATKFIEELDRLAEQKETDMSTRAAPARNQVNPRQADRLAASARAG